jgi:hypothetical protein
MAYNNKSLLKDGGNLPIPQQYDQANDIYEQLKKMEYYGLSTDTKPSPSITPKGATFLEIDTKVVFINNGTQWVVF